jgi:hypothetical protein
MTAVNIIALIGGIANVGLLIHCIKIAYGNNNLTRNERAEVIAACLFLIVAFSLIVAYQCDWIWS